MVLGFVGSIVQVMFVTTQSYNNKGTKCLGSLRVNCGVRKFMEMGFSIIQMLKEIYKMKY